MEINIPKYNSNEGIKSTWEPGFEITVKNEEEVTISANKAGLISLATQLLTLAQEEVPVGAHFHFDDYNSLEKGSSEMIIEKI